MTDKSITYEVSYQEIYDGRRSYKIIRSINKSIKNGETISNSKELQTVLIDTSISDLVEKMKCARISDKLIDQFNISLQIVLSKATGIIDIIASKFVIADDKDYGFFLLFIPSIHALLLDPRISSLIKFWITESANKVDQYNIRLIMSQNLINKFDSKHIEAAYGFYGNNVDIQVMTTDNFTKEITDLLWIR